jgi:FixJ family two-component response regulator
MTGSTVYVVDDDARVREAMQDLLSASGFNVIVFGSAAEYVANSAASHTPACLVLDIELPDINGLELQRQLSKGEHPPIVFITGHGDIPSSVRAMKAGAVDFLPKPFTEEQLLGAISVALEQHRQSRQDQVELSELRKRFASLTPRERDVVPLIVSGLLNKQAAGQLGISEVTLQIHRGRVMRKMEADSLADLVRMSIKLGVGAAGSAGGAAAESDSGHAQMESRFS